MASTHSASMDLIPAKVQEGKLIAALSLEQRVLANGVLPNAPLPERASLVNGIIYGLLEKGEWNEAIRLVYKDGSPARVLFDGDWDGLRKGILASVQQKREWYIGDNVEDLLVNHGEAELLYDIACKLPLEERKFAHILATVEPKLPAEKMKEGYNAAAVRAEQRKDFAKAYRFYTRAENIAAISALYQNIFENFAPNNLEILLTIAEETNTTQNSRAGQTVYAVLNQPRLLGFSRDTPRRLMGMVRKHKLALAKSQDDLLKDALVSQLALYELRDITEHGDVNLPLRWAKFHAEDEPKEAYGVFKSRKYQGPEINLAVQQGLKNREEKHDHYQGLLPHDIDEPHLRQAYDSSSLEIKVSIASHLKDNALLQDLSKQFSKQKKEGSVERAYHLWIYGQGDQQDPYVEKLRASMIKKELKDERPSASLFLPKDKIGNRRWYLQMVQRDPTVAYDIAKRIDDPALVSEVRILMVKKSPLDALHKFQSHRPEDTDTVGVNLALDALAKQYGVSRDKIDGYLALRK